MRSIQFNLVQALKKGLFTVGSIFGLLLLPGVGFSQEPGSNPDVPLNGQGVPFDSNMNIALLVVGVIFAVYKIRQVQKKKAANSLITAK